MKEHPILFSTPMVQAILEGRKTQTRRVIKPQPDEEPYFADKIVMWYAENKPKGLSDCPYGQPGDLLWVREKFAWTVNKYVSHDTLSFFADNFHCDVRRPGVHLHETDICEEGWHDTELSKELKWKPSIHMPKAAARIWLKVKHVRVERLQEISEEDAVAEGIYLNEFQRYECIPCDYKGHKGGDLLCEDGFFRSARNSFQSLWQSINGRESWDANPWVWVVEFERVEAPSNSPKGGEQEKESATNKVQQS